MADQAEVEQALQGIASFLLYPNGPAAASALAVRCRIFRGWPHASLLDASLARGEIMVSIAMVTGSEQVTTRYLEGWQTLPPPPLSLTVTVNGNAASFAGVGAAGQLAGLAAGSHAYVYQVGNGDTPQLVAAALAAYASPDQPVQVTGATVTLPDAATIVARVGAPRQAWREMRRQRQLYRLACWCPSPALRDQTAALLDVGLAGLTFLQLPDGTQGRLRYHNSAVNDEAVNAGLYRRDLCYSVEYATTLQAAQATLLFGGNTVNSVTTTFS